jgi:sugar phosphate isomerase/epimerase
LLRNSAELIINIFVSFNVQYSIQTFRDKMFFGPLYITLGFNRRYKSGIDQKHENVITAYVVLLFLICNFVKPQHRKKYFLKYLKQTNMTNKPSRRAFLQTSAISATAMMLPVYAVSSVKEKKQDNSITLNQNPLKIGLMTYTLGKDWDIETIIKNCTEAEWKSVELRTTHKHGVEVTLSAAQREAVKKRFKDSALETISLASAFQYHSPDQAEVRKNIEGTREFIKLARDVGATGVRVFPNAFTDGTDKEKTMEQIGKALAEVGAYGNDNGVEIRVCVHGKGTNTPPVIKKIIDYSQSPYVFVNWNCGEPDSEGEGFEYNFNLLKDRIKGVHMHELYNTKYPYRLFLKLLAESGYKGYCNAEVGQSCEPAEFMKYYRALFLALQNAI